MGKIFKVSSDGGLPLIPESEYPATYEGYVEAPGLPHGNALRLKFRISSGKHEGTVVTCLASDKFTPKSKLFSIVTTILGKEPEEEGVDSDKLVGMPCVVAVKTKKNSQGDFSRVEEVKPENKEMGGDR